MSASDRQATSNSNNSSSSNSGTPNFHIHHSSIGGSVVHPQLGVLQSGGPPNSSTGFQHHSPLQGHPQQQQQPQPHLFHHPSALKLANICDLSALGPSAVNNLSSPLTSSAGSSRNSPSINAMVGGPGGPSTVVAPNVGVNNPLLSLTSFHAHQRSVAAAAAAAAAHQQQQQISAAGSQLGGPQHQQTSATGPHLGASQHQSQHQQQQQQPHHPTALHPHQVQQQQQTAHRQFLNAGTAGTGNSAVPNVSASTNVLKTSAAVGNIIARDLYPPAHTLPNLNMASANLPPNYLTSSQQAVAAAAAAATLHQQQAQAQAQQQQQQQQSQAQAAQLQQRLKVEDALSYLDQVKVQFSNKPHVYNEFLDIMKEFKASTIDTPGVVERVVHLFRGHPNLIVGFNTFLPAGYKIEVNGECGECISIVQPSGRSHVLVSCGEDQGLNPHGMIQPQIDNRSVIVNGQTKQSAVQQPLEFNEAISYVNKIKTRYIAQPEVYKTFLDILHRYQKEQRDINEGTVPPGRKTLTEREVYDKVARLFADQPDLLREFGQFLPDATSTGGFMQVQHPSIHQLQPPSQSSTSAVVTPVLIAPIISSLPPQLGPVAGGASAIGAPPTGCGSGGLPSSSSSLTSMTPSGLGLMAAANELSPLSSSSMTSSMMMINLPPSLRTMSPAPPAYEALSPAVTSLTSGQVVARNSGPGKHTGSNAGTPIAGSQQTGLTAGKPHLAPPPPHLGGSTGGHVTSTTTTSMMVPHIQHKSSDPGPVSHVTPVQQQQHQQSSVIKRPALKESPVKNVPIGSPPKKQIKMDVINHDLNLGEAVSCGSLQEYEYFDKIRKALKDEENYKNFLRCLVMYNQEIFSKTDLMQIMMPFLSKHPDILKWFREFIGCNELGVYGNCPEAVPNSALGSAEHFAVPQERISSDLAMEIDYASCKRNGVSYRALPASYVQPKSSGRTQLCDEVLNDTWVSFPSWQSEDSTFVSSKKTQYEENIYRTEDERFELDILIENNKSLIEVLETVQKRMSQMLNAEEAKKFQLNDCLGARSKFLYRKTLKRLYANKADEVYEGLVKNPYVAIPVILERLKCKDQEWRDAQKSFNRIWREQNEKHYWKSLDHQGLNFKQNDYKLIRSKALISQIETLYEERKEMIEEGADPVPHGPHMELQYPTKDNDIFYDVNDLLIHHVKRQAGLQKSEKLKIKKLLKVTLPQLFGVHAETLSDDENDNEDKEDDDAASVHSANNNNSCSNHHHSSSKGVTTRKAKLLKQQQNSNQSGNGTGLNFRAASACALYSDSSPPSSSSTRHVTSSSAIVVGSRDEPIPSSSCSTKLTSDGNNQSGGNTKNSTKKETVKKLATCDYSVVMIPNAWYVFLRLHQLLYERLYKLKQYADQMAEHYRESSKQRGRFGAEATDSAPSAAKNAAKFTNNANASDRRTNSERSANSNGKIANNPKSASNAKSSNNSTRANSDDEDPIPASTGPPPADALKCRPKNSCSPKDYYPTLIQLIKNLLDGQIDSVQFEDSLRDMYIIQAYLAYTMDKIVQTMVKQLQTMVSEETCVQLNELYEKWAESGGAGDSPLCTFNSKKFEEKYQHEAERLAVDQNCFKATFVRTNRKLKLELLKTEDDDDEDEAEEPGGHVTPRLSNVNDESSSPAVVVDQSEKSKQEQQHKEESKQKQNKQQQQETTSIKNESEDDQQEQSKEVLLEGALSANNKFSRSSNYLNEFLEFNVDLNSTADTFLELLFAKPVFLCRNKKRMKSWLNFIISATQERKTSKTGSATMISTNATIIPTVLVSPPQRKLACDNSGHVTSIQPQDTQLPCTSGSPAVTTTVIRGSPSTKMMSSANPLGSLPPTDLGCLQCPVSSGGGGSASLFDASTSRDDHFSTPATSTAFMSANATPDVSPAGSNRSMGSSGGGQLTSNIPVVTTTDPTLQTPHSQQQPAVTITKTLLKIPYIQRPNEVLYRTGAFRRAQKNRLKCTESKNRRFTAWHERWMLANVSMEQARITGDWFMGRSDDMCLDSSVWIQRISEPSPYRPPSLTLTRFLSQNSSNTSNSMSTTNTICAIGGPHAASGVIPGGQQGVTQVTPAVFAGLPLGPSVVFR